MKYHVPNEVVTAFHAPYIGSAANQFNQYLATGLSAYYTHGKNFKAPCTTITQSAGFGKSRLMKELAEFTAEGHVLESDGFQFDLTLLYVCLKRSRATGYPRPTHALRAWLFP